MSRHKHYESRLYYLLQLLITCNKFVVFGIYECANGIIVYVCIYTKVYSDF